MQRGIAFDICSEQVNVDFCKFFSCYSVRTMVEERAAKLTLARVNWFSNNQANNI